MALSKEAQEKRNEYMRNYMREYNKKHPSKKAKQNEQYWENKAKADKGGETVCK